VARAKKKTSKKKKPAATLVKDIITAVEKDLQKDKSRGKKYRIGTLSDIPPGGVREWISTGSILINGIIKRPGIPVGRLTVVTGRPSSGKTTLAAHLIAQAQKMDAIVMLIDSETKFFGSSRAANIGVDVNRARYIPGPIALEEVFGIIIRTIRVAIAKKSKKLFLIIVDSHSATPTRSDLNAVDKDKPPRVAASASVTSFYLKTVMSLLEEARVALVFICQPRVKVGAMSFGPAPETFLAERPIMHHAVLALRMVKIGRLERTVRGKKQFFGIQTKVVCIKSNIGPSWGDCVVECRDDTGINETIPLLHLAIRHDIVRQMPDKYFRLSTDTHGTNKFRQQTWGRLLEVNPELLDRLSGICSEIPEDGDNNEDETQS